MTQRAKLVAAVLGFALLAPLAARRGEAAPAKEAKEEGESAEKEEQPAVKAQRKRRAFAKLRAILEKEPSAREVQRATLRFYKLEPERIERMATAARLKGLFPEFEAGIDNTLGHTFSNTKDGLYPGLSGTPEDPNPNHYKEQVAGTSDQLLWRLRAVWSLDRLVFNSEALDVKSLSSIEENLVREVTTLYFSRRRALAGYILSHPKDDEEAFYDKLHIDELTSTLDALTGNMFSARAWKGDDEE